MVIGRANVVINKSWVQLAVACCLILAQSGCKSNRSKQVASVESQPPLRDYRCRPTHPPPVWAGPSQAPAAPRIAGPSVIRPGPWLPAGRPISPRWNYVVIHHSATPAGGARAFDRHHRSNGWDELGYHFVIGNGSQTPDGFVEVGPRWHKQKHGAHCKTPGNYYNEHGIGICLVGDFTSTRPTKKQLASLARLTRFLCQSCGIPAERVTTHAGVTHKTQCPGRNFPLQHLRDAIRSPALAGDFR
ncbi:MAG: peptidoglycan recognition family protein [Planctomycetota bacterium]